MTLDRLPVGRPAVVREIIGDEPAMLRLRVMGLFVGSGVHTLRGGSRMIVCVGGTRIGLAGEIARAVTVEPLPEQAACGDATNRSDR